MHVTLKHLQFWSVYCDLAWDGMAWHVCSREGFGRGEGEEGGMLKQRVRWKEIIGDGEDYFFLAPCQIELFIN